MDLHRLRSFYHVALCGGFSAAARRLGVSQPSISLQVKGLETELGVKLLERGGRRVRMTEDGEILFRFAEKLFESVEAIESRFAERAGTTREHLTVSTNQSVAAHILPPILTKYRARYPKVEISIHNLSTSEIVSSVREGTTQVGIILIDPKIAGIESRPVLPYEMVLVTPRDHPLGQRRRVTLEDIVEHPFISYTRDTETRRLIDQPFEELELKTSIVMALGSTDLIITYVSQGYGISIIHNLNIDEANRENLAVRPMGRYYARQHVHLIYRGGDSLSAAAKAFCDLF